MLKPHATCIGCAGKNRFRRLTICSRFVADSLPTVRRAIHSTKRRDSLFTRCHSRSEGHKSEPMPKTICCMLPHRKRSHRKCRMSSKKRQIESNNTANVPAPPSRRLVNWFESFNVPCLQVVAAFCAVRVSALLCQWRFKMFHWINYVCDGVRRITVWLMKSLELAPMPASCMQPKRGKKTGKISGRTEILAGLHQRQSLHHLSHSQPVRKSAPHVCE